MSSATEPAQSVRQSIESALRSHLPDGASIAPDLVAAMRYSTLAGGKRLRPLLCYAAAEACSTNPVSDSEALVSVALATGCAIEMVHTYSLIHDDLPAMDNDQLRRGKPTCHVQFNEAEAILAGDALQALAFEILAGQPLPAEARLQLISTLAQAIGWSGMVGGQSFDIALTGLSSANETITQTQLETLHAAKTGALLKASIEMGAIAARPTNDSCLQSCGQIGSYLGLAFQVIDDVLDVSKSTEELGKDAGSDAAQGKTTFIDLLGEDGARAYAIDLFEKACNELTSLPGSTALLEAAAREVVFRDH